MLSQAMGTDGVACWRELEGGVLSRGAGGGRKRGGLQVGSVRVEASMQAACITSAAASCSVFWHASRVCTVLVCLHESMLTMQHQRQPSSGCIVAWHHTRPPLPSESSAMQVPHDAP